MKKMLIAAALGVMALLATAGSAQAQCPNGDCGNGGGGWGGGPTWHGAYAHSAYGGPVALVVPHRARKHTNYMWGNPSTNTTHIRSRFGAGNGGGDCGSYGGGGGGYAGGIYPTPAWPSHTDQFGVYYVRAPRRY
jgi:hypothetical protein